MPCSTLPSLRSPRGTLAAIMLLSACGANETIAPAAPRVLTVGVVQSLSGTAAVYGKAVVEGEEGLGRLIAGPCLWQVLARQARIDIRQGPP